MPSTVVVGGFFGDEGKGKLISYLALHDKPALIARGGVGPNAGHTVKFKDKTFFLRMIPSGVVYEEAKLLIGPGVLVNPSILLKEVEETGCQNRVGIDKQCAIIEEKHIQQEVQSNHLSKKIGSTKSGVGACNSERALRLVKLAKDLTELKPYITDVPLELWNALKNNEKILIEGTQGTFLSLYHGTYPYCTSKDVCASAICSDVGVGPTNVDKVIVVFKAYVTRVGEGPLEGELNREETIKRGWLEYGTVTRRERRAAPFNFELAKRAVLLNGATEAAITKIDVVYPDCAGAKNYGELTMEAKSFIKEVEKKLGVPVTLISTGPDAEDMVDRRD
ncbi:adenylosuccinate synthetase [Candidatus Bathyarchaeota archaeon]|nr:adenylosuccinate synthetase [Candidatus Bathyarchaeota archaeon]